MIGASCSQVVETAVRGFFDALASGDANEAAGYSAQASFGALSEAPLRVGEEAGDRSTLEPYLADRIADGASYDLVTLDYNGMSGSNLGNFGLRLRNENGDDLDGKGAIDCGGNGIVYLGIRSPG